MLYHIYKKIKDLIVDSKKELILGFILVLTSTASFGLGRLSAIWPKHQEVVIRQWQGTITETNLQRTDSATGTAERQKDNSTFSIRNSTLGTYVESKNSTEYHFPWCSGTKRIKEENKIWFQTKEEAVAKGYKPAVNCEGL